MAISKKFLKTKPVCKVTFEFSATEASEVYLVGDFNNWDSSAHPLKKAKNGDFKIVIDLDTDKSYEYKFVIDGIYVNDEAAESLVWNDFSNSENSLITL